MKLIDKMLDKFGLVTKTQVNELTAVMGRITDKYGVPIPQNYNKYLEAYGDESWVYACVYVIANTIAGMPYRIYKKRIVNNRVEKIPVLNTPVNKLLDRPNMNDGNSTWYNLQEWTTANLELTGNAYWLLDKIAGKKPQEIQMLPTANMRVVPGKTKDDPFIMGYKYMKGDATAADFTNEQIAHFKYMSSNNMYYGQGSLAPGRYSIDSHKEAQVQNLNMFRNGVNIDAMLETDKPLNDKQFNRLRDSFLNRHQGSHAAHLPTILEGGLKYKSAFGTMKDLEFIQGIKLNREEICSVFGVPPVLVGILDRATYQNFQEAKKVFLIFNIIPKLRRLEEVIEGIVQRFDPALFFEYDTTNEDALRTDEKANAEIAKLYFDMGVPLDIINERFDLGFPKIPGGDVGYLSFALAPATQVAEGKPEPTPAPDMIPDGDDDEEGKSKKATLKTVYTKERKLKLAKQFEDFISKIEVRYQSIIETFFMGIEMTVLRKLNSKKSINKEINVEMYLYDEAEAIKQWKAKSKRVHTAALATNGQVQLDNMGVAVMFNVDNPLVRDFIEKYSLEKSVEVIGSNREVLATALSEGIEAGEGIPALSKRIREVYEPYRQKAYKAVRIARTEVVGASNRGALEAYRQADVGAKKFWNPAYINTRDSHLQAGMRYNEENAIPLDANFEVGAGSGPNPGSIGLAEEDINCACQLLPAVEA